MADAQVGAAASRDAREDTDSVEITDVGSYRLITSEMIEVPCLRVIPM